MKDLLRGLAYRSGVFGLWHRLRNRKALTVLMFHRVLPDGDLRFGLADREFTMSLSGFSRSLDFIARHYNVVRLEEVHRWAAGLAKLPPCPILLTFDDGWRDTLIYAAPELQRRHWSAVLFLTSEVPGLQAPRWWQDALVQAWAEIPARSRLWVAAGFDSATPLSNGVWKLSARLAAWPELERIAWLEEHAPGAVTAIQQRQMLTAEELLQVESAVLEVAGHGHTHAPLTLAVDPLTELCASYRLVKQHHTGVAAMSFPHGAWNPALVEQAQQVGFELVFNSEPILNCRSDAVRPRAIPLGRIHLPENEWTCHDGIIDVAKLASFLFWRTQVSSFIVP